MSNEKQVASRSEPIQVASDEVLLDLMMDDLRKAEQEFQPTNYWAAYEPRFMRELNMHGLKDMRRQKNLVFWSFGAVDFVHPVAELTFRNSRVFKRWPMNTAGLTRLAVRFDALMSRYIKTVDSLDFDSYVRLGYAYAQEYARGSRARPLSEF
jgi:hypothetical protein